MAINIEVFIRVIITFILSIIISSSINKFIIKKEKEKHVGQAVRDDIISTHFQKSGTPTMGGVGIVLATIITSLLNFSFIDYKIIIVLLLMFMFFIIGFVDDYIKVKYKNSKGLSASLRFSLEIMFTLIALVLLNYDQQSMWHLHLPNNFIYLGPLFVLLIVFMVVGSANAVNMSDGLDGLAGGLIILAYLPFLLIALKEQNYAASILISGVIGGNIGFLIHNAHPAKIFMGDSGSLANGALISLLAFLLNSEYLLIVSGGIFVIETVSVILQVGYFKMTHKRIFKMAPIHHHFEALGMKEYQVVNMFYLVGFILAFLSLIMGGIL
ncbi:MAG: phospho-N-acetylmuramoyl-pentapeptide-transferase [Erysipelotrichales bacterium]|nr:phospho-N-acetylmuramoyl-pentapeptide-transferase [Erysipelotrichales bacterium]